jgi:3-deoxy-7-phosphoheptulonate synthase
MMDELPRSAFPDPGSNPALRILDARQRIQQEAEEELENVGRRSFRGRNYVDASTITLALMRRQRGEPDGRIEEALGIKKGRLSALVQGMITSV